MYYGKRTLILFWVAAAAAGTLLHFLYQWLPCAVTSLFSPVNESLWEHIKLIFWPCLAAAILLNRDRPGGIYPWLFSLGPSCAFMLAAGYLYHILLGGDAMWVDILIYLAAVSLSFCLPLALAQPPSAKVKALGLLFTLVLAVMIPLFTLYPPNRILFADLSAAGAWFPLPC